MDLGSLSVVQLRAELERQNRRATRKIRKIKKGEYIRRGDALEYLRGQYGVDISNTEHDPRVSKSHANRLNRRQLIAAIRRVDEFSSSQNISFFADANGQPISSAAVRSAVFATRRYNRMLQDYKDRVADTPIPWIGENMTAGEYDAIMRMGKEFLESQSFYHLKERRLPTPRRFPSESKAKEWVSALEKELLPSAQRHRIAFARDQVSAMMEIIGDTELENRLKALNDDTFWFMWTNDSSMADAISLIYEHAKNKDSPNKSDYYKSIMEDISVQQHGKLESLIEYGEKISFS